MYSKPIDNLVSYFMDAYRGVSDNIKDLLFPKPGGLELAMSYAGFSNTHQDRPHAGIKDNPQNYYSFAATYVGPYENKGNGQVVVTRTTDGKSIALEGINANGQIEIYVKRVL